MEENKGNKINKIKEIKPLFDVVITTAYVDEMEKRNGIIMLNKNKGTISLYQKVLATGDSVANIKVGDIVHINPLRYGKPKYKDGSLKDGIIESNFMVEFDFPTVEINDCECLKLTNRDFDFIVKDFE